MSKKLKLNNLHPSLLGFGKIFGIIFAVLIITGCAETISDKFRKQVGNQNLTFDQLIKNPDQYIEDNILLGGVIVSTENKNDGTLIEIYQTDLNSSGEPENIDVSHGRFLAWYKGFLDSQIYRSGRKLTIVGVVKGTEDRKIGEINYHYPYLIIKDIYLWNRTPLRYHPYYHHGYYGPWWWDPWYGGFYPYWGFNYYHYPSLTGITE
jgi:outer membrane lipoprotein